MDPIEKSLIDEKFDGDLKTQLAGWSALTGDITPPVTKSSQPLSFTSTSQSVSNQPSLTASTSNHSTTSTSLQSHVKQTYAGVAVRIMPPYARLVNNVETNNNNRPVIAARNKLPPIVSHQTATEQFLKFQLKKTQELLSAAIDKLDDNRNAYKVLEKENHELQLDKAKLQYENKQLRDHQVTLMAHINAQTPSMVSTANSTSKLYSNEETVDDISTNPDLLYNLIEIGPNDHSVVDSNEPSTSAQLQSMRIASKPPTGSISQNLNKRKASQSRGPVKRFKKTVEDKVEEEEEEEDISKDNRVADKIKVVHLDCTEQNCEAKLNSLNHFNDHLLTAHGLLPFKCFAQDCTLRFDNGTQMSNHLKLQHSNAANFVCNVCRKQFSSHMVAHDHWRNNHLIGQFECNLNECRQVFDIRGKVRNHQRRKQCVESDRLQCQHDGCEASFVTKWDLKRHEMIHLGKKPFQCSWDQCSHSTNRRSDLIRHIRVRHFGLPESLKEQAAKNIVDQRDPNEYVRVAVEE